MEYKEIEIGISSVSHVADACTHLRATVVEAYGHVSRYLDHNYKSLICLHLIVKVPMSYYHLSMPNLSIVRVSIEVSRFSDYLRVVRQLLDDLMFSTTIKELYIARTHSLAMICDSDTYGSIHAFFATNASITSFTCKGLTIPYERTDVMFSNINRNMKLVVLDFSEIYVTNEWVSNVLPKLHYLHTISLLHITSSDIFNSLQFTLSRLDALRVVKLIVNYNNTECMAKLPNVILAARNLNELHVTHMGEYVYMNSERTSIHDAMCKNTNIELILRDEMAFVSECNRSNKRGREFRLQQWASAVVLICAARTRASLHHQVLSLIPMIMEIAGLTRHKEVSISRFTETAYFNRMVSNMY